VAVSSVGPSWMRGSAIAGIAMRAAHKAKPRSRAARPIRKAGLAWARVRECSLKKSGS
jgi:hypothetical protein